MSTHTKKTVALFFLIFTLTLCLVGYTAYASTKVKTFHKPTATLQKLIEDRLTRYQNFADNIPTSINEIDRLLLTAQINNEITRLQMSISSTSTVGTSTKKLSQKKNATTTRLMNDAIPMGSSEGILNMKISLLTVAFHITGQHTASSTIPSDLIHELIIASSTNDVLNIQKTILGQLSVRPKIPNVFHPRVTVQSTNHFPVETTKVPNSNYTNSSSSTDGLLIIASSSAGVFSNVSIVATDTPATSTTTSTTTTE